MDLRGVDLRSAPVGAEPRSPGPRAPLPKAQSTFVITGSVTRRGKKRVPQDFIL